MSEAALPASVQAMVDAIGIFVIEGDKLASFTIPPSH